MTLIEGVVSIGDGEAWWRLSRAEKRYQVF